MLRAAQVVLEEGIAEPILIGRPHVIEVRLKRHGLRIKPGVDFGLINPEDDPRYRHYVDLLIELAGRRTASCCDGLAHAGDADRLCRTRRRVGRRNSRGLCDSLDVGGHEFGQLGNQVVGIVLATHLLRFRRRHRQRPLIS